MAPATPNTDALFAMLTNQTPGTGDTDGGKKRDPDQFDASFKAANSRNASVVDRTDVATPTQGSVLASCVLPASSGVGTNEDFATSTPSIAPSMVTAPNHGSSTMFLPTVVRQVPQVPPSISASIPNGAAVGLGGPTDSLLSEGQPPLPPRAYASDDPTNPLYLLTQAQQLSQTTDDTAVMAAAALSNLNSSSLGYQSLSQGGGGPAIQARQQPQLHHQQSQQQQQQQHQQQQLTAAPSPSRSLGGGTRGTRRGAPGGKRKKDESSEPTATRAKRGAKKTKMEEETSDDDEDESGGGMSSPGARSPDKAQTEEEKRKNFLERNRQGLLLE
jgi:ATF/CREB family transcription factor